MQRFLVGGQDTSHGMIIPVLGCTIKWLVPVVSGHSPFDGGISGVH